MLTRNGQSLTRGAQRGHSGDGQEAPEEHYIRFKVVEASLWVNNSVSKSTKISVFPVTCLRK
jgi:hypothetical protein